MFARFYLLLVLLPLVEIVILAWIASKTSILLVVGLVILTGVVGVALMRHQGRAALRQISSDLERGQAPAASLVDGVLVFAAAVLLILPGVLSDVLAIALLFPPSRRAIRALIGRYFQARAVTSYGFPSYDTSHGDQVIDVRVIDPTAPRLPE